MSSHLFVYQEWDVLREQTHTNELRVEKTIPTVRNVSFSAKMQEMRIKNRMTIKDIAEKLNVDCRTISMYENGSEMPSTSQIEKLKDILNID